VSDTVNRSLRCFYLERSNSYFYPLPFAVFFVRLSVCRIVNVEHCAEIALELESVSFFGILNFWWVEFR
jgi:hypothetical protein